MQGCFSSCRSTVLGFRVTDIDLTLSIDHLFVRSCSGMSSSDMLTFLQAMAAFAVTRKGDRVVARRVEDHRNLQLKAINRGRLRRLAAFYEQDANKLVGQYEKIKHLVQMLAEETPTLTNAHGSDSHNNLTIYVY